MKSLIKLALVGTAVFSLCSFSENSTSPLRPVPQNPSDVVDDSNKSRLSCGEIVAALEEYNTLARANEEAFAEFVLQLTGVMYEWYGQLSPLEGSSETIRRGTFNPIQEGAVQIEEVVGLVYENSDQLKFRMEVIIQSLKNCL